MKKFALILSLLIQSTLSHAEVKVAEVQFAICGATAAQVAQKLNLEVKDRKSRKTYYQETKDLDFYKSGVVIRFRDTGKKIKSAVKLKYGQATQVPWQALEKLSDWKCEKDLYLGQSKVGCSIRSEGADLKLNREQIQFLKSEVGIDEDGFANSRILGPLNNVELELYPGNDLERTIDQIQMPNGELSVELSVRTNVGDSAQVQRAWALRLHEAGVGLCSTQAGRTGAILKLLTQH